MAIEDKPNSAFTDLNYTRRKLDLATRIAENREKRTKLRQTLAEYVRMEKTGKTSIEDPMTRQAILKIEETIESEETLRKQLEDRLFSNESELERTNKRLKELSEMIQNQKEMLQSGTGESSIFLESRKLQLKEREQQLKEIIKNKETRLINIKAEFEKLKQEREKLSKQREFLKTLKDWKEGSVPEENKIFKTAHSLFINSREKYRLAAEAKDSKLMEAFYLQAEDSLLAGIDCLYILTQKDISNYMVLEYHVKIDALFKQKVVVNPTLLNSLNNLTEKLRDGVDISPAPNFKEDIWEYVTKNLQSMKII